MNRILRNFVSTNANITNIYTSKIISDSTSPSRILLSGVALNGPTGIGCEMGLDYNDGNSNGVYFRGGTNSVDTRLRFLLNSDGTVYIDCKTYSTTSYKTLVIRGSTVIIENTSDIKLKKNITDTEEQNTTQNLKNIKLRSFDWIADDKHQTIGIIANELREIYPDIISDMKTHPDETELLGVKGVMGDAMFLRLLKAFQEQQVQIEELKNEILLLKATS